jgi:hypothetical protein
MSEIAPSICFDVIFIQDDDMAAAVQPLQRQQIARCERNSPPFPSFGLSACRAGLSFIGAGGSAGLLTRCNGIAGQYAVVMLFLPVKIAQGAALSVFRVSLLAEKGRRPFWPLCVAVPSGGCALPLFLPMGCGGVAWAGCRV